jgi:hypothetical protein
MTRSKFGRRDLLRAMGSGLALFTPVEMLAQTMINGMFAKAAAAAGGARPRNYLVVNMYGAPARWGFDNPLRVNPGEALLPGAMVGTRFSDAEVGANGQPKLAYATHDVNGLQMPHLWSFDVPRARGGTRPMSDLMRNMLILRGFDMGLDGHSINNTRIITPVPGGACLNGLVADGSDALMPAISIGTTPGQSAYYAPRGTGLIDIPFADENYLDFLMAPFYGLEADFFRDEAHVDATVGRALGALRTFSNQANPAADALYRDQQNAENLLRGGIDGFGEVYRDLVAKYDDLVARSVQNTNLPGLTDKPIPGLMLPFTVPGDVSVDLAIGKYRSEGVYLGNADLRTLFNQATVRYLAQQFALAEYVLLRGLSASLIIAPGPIANLNFENAVKRTEVVRTMTTPLESRFDLTPGAKLTTSTDIRNALSGDPHFTGSYLSLLGTSLYFRAMGSCLTELIDQIRATTISNRSVFDETVIHLAAEFDRSPRPDGSGSDHGWRGNTASIFCGAIDQPMILGNIYNVGDPYRDTGSQEEIGTWGAAAPVRGLKKRAMNLGNVLSSLAMLTRVASPTPNERPVIRVSGDATIATIEKGQLVEQP